MGTSASAVSPVPRHRKQFGWVEAHGADADTGLLYMRQRWYDPTLQRFISRDPIGLAGGANLYSYANNSPADLTDARGLQPQTPEIPDLPPDTFSDIPVAPPSPIGKEASYGKGELRSHINKAGAIPVIGIPVPGGAFWVGYELKFSCFCPNGRYVGADVEIVDITAASPESGAFRLPSPSLHFVAIVHCRCEDSCGKPFEGKSLGGTGRWDARPHFDVWHQQFPERWPERRVI